MTTAPHAHAHALAYALLRAQADMLALAAAEAEPEGREKALAQAAIAHHAASAIAEALADSDFAERLHSAMRAWMNTTYGTTEAAPLIAVFDAAYQVLDTPLKADEAT